MLSDGVTAAIAGYLALKVMDQVTTWTYAQASEADKQQEKAVSPGVAYTVAARKTAGVIGLSMTEEQATALGSVYHYLLGLGWAPVYLVLRRVTGVAPLAAGLATGLGLWAGFDEGLVPTLGFSAPNRAYPRSTHLRGLVGPLVYVLTIMAPGEAVSGARAGA